MFKTKIYILTFFILTCFSFNFVQADNRSLPLFGKIIYIDAGHGGADPGAMYKDILEKNINLEIALKLEKVLLKEGAIVYQTRKDDYDLAATNYSRRKLSDLSGRAKIINNSQCDLFISIHLNSITNTKWSGAQIFYTEKNNKNKGFAKVMQEEFKNNLNSDRKYKKISNVYMLNNINRPGILIEVGFLSNGNDRYLLQNKKYQHKVSNVIKKGILRYFEDDIYFTLNF